MARRSGWQGPPPEEIVAWTVVQAGHAVGRRFWTALAEVDLTPVQFGVLLHLDRDTGLSNAGLARRVLVTPQSMSELMAGLVAAGLVERDAPQGRGRPITARLTSAGRTRLRACQRVVADVEASLGLEADDAVRLNGLLHRVVQAAGGDAAGAE